MSASLSFDLLTLLDEIVLIKSTTSKDFSGFPGPSEINNPFGLCFNSCSFVKQSFEFKSKCGFIIGHKLKMAI